jgi:hypothetical protein
MPSTPSLLGGGTDFNALAQQMAGPAPQIPIRPTPMGGFSPMPGQGGLLDGGPAPGMSNPVQQQMPPPASILPNQFMPGGYFPPGFLM